LTKKTTGIREQTFTFDTITGNLTMRGFKKGLSNRNEAFTYDGLDRLVSVTGSGRSPAYFTYSPNGNLMTKTGIGSYYYNEDKINAVDSIINNPGAILPGPQNIYYTSFNKVSSINDSINKKLYRLEITYGPDQQRVKNIFKENGATTKTKYYAPGYEKEVISSGTRELYYVNCPYGLVAINIRKNGADSTYYVDSDHLGSILALIRNNGSQAAEYSYDEWGRRRRPSNWNLYDSIPNLGFIDRGYTGHEHYYQFGLIDMNGRVYDPIIGRFLSPDPVIQSPDFTQNYNSYSYCFNNPLKYIDPSGYSSFQGDDCWAQYISNLGNGYGGDYGKFQDGYYESYYDYQIYGSSAFSGGSGTSIPSGGKQYVWFEKVPTGKQIVTSHLERYQEQMLIVIDSDVEVTYIKHTISFAKENTFSGLNVAGALLAIEDIYNNFVHDHTRYVTTKGLVKNIYTNAGKVRSAQAAEALTASKAVKYAGEIGTALMTAQAGYKIANGKAQSIDVCDFTVGTVGLTSAGIEYFTVYTIPYVGEGVALYGWFRLVWDLGQEYGPSTWFGDDDSKYFN
jgi:RHS repeat-associated protein